MQRSDPLEQEDGFWLLQPHAAMHLQRLVAAFEAETDWGLRGWLLELIGEARDERALPLLARELRNDDLWLSSWAIHGLQKLGTREARLMLYEARDYTFGSEEATREFREMLASITAQPRRRLRPPST